MYKKFALMLFSAVGVSDLGLTSVVQAGSIDPGGTVFSNGSWCPYGNNNPNTVQLRNTIETILNTPNYNQRKNQPFRASRISLNP